ncbi:hypothetical protein PsYK624_004060 [Phanerochaete sordida]|uniref:Uncharacterized protein n=1 Tax=Phanerochaete sordida TaxID=48140 RepID=A0A9P3FY23_9APHY|nr:hypothetical protein PsYK624_004060 [Phanerochaete sordida]
MRFPTGAAQDGPRNAYAISPGCLRIAHTQGSFRTPYHSETVIVRLPPWTLRASDACPSPYLLTSLLIHQNIGMTHPAALEPSTSRCFGLLRVGQAQQLHGNLKPGVQQCEHS